MSDFQYQLWLKMVDSINNYLIDQKINFGGMVFKLEQILELAEVQDDKILTEWEELWLPLEAIYADNLEGY